MSHYISNDTAFNRKNYDLIIQYELNHTDDNEKVIEFICSSDFSDFIVVLINAKNEIVFDIIINNTEQYDKLLSKAIVKYNQTPVRIRINKEMQHFTENDILDERNEEKLICVVECDKNISLSPSYCFRKILQKDVYELFDRLANKNKNELYSVIHECIVHPEYNYGELFGLFYKNKLCGYICGRQICGKAYHIIHCNSIEEKNKKQIEEAMIYSLGFEKNNHRIYITVDKSENDEPNLYYGMKYCFLVRRG